MSTQHTERQLLELAAKAAGLEINARQQRARDALINPATAGLWIIDGPTAWNPLRNDADALRLAVKLHLSIDHNHPADQQPWVSADRQGCEGCYAPVSCVEDEFEEPQRGAATRRAIVRAAAAIGEAMP